MAVSPTPGGRRGFGCGRTATAVVALSVFLLHLSTVGLHWCHRRGAATQWRFLPNVPSPTTSFPPTISHQPTPLPSSAEICCTNQNATMHPTGTAPTFPNTLQPTRPPADTPALAPTTSPPSLPTIITEQPTISSQPTATDASAIDNIPSLMPSAWGSGSPSTDVPSAPPSSSRFTSLAPSNPPSTDIPTFAPTYARLPSSKPSGLPSHDTGSPTRLVPLETRETFEQVFSFETGKLSFQEENVFEGVLNSLTEDYGRYGGTPDVITSSKVEGQDLLESSSRRTSTSLNIVSNFHRQTGSRKLNSVEVRMRYTIVYQSRKVDVSSYPDEFVSYMGLKLHRDTFEGQLIDAGIDVISGTSTKASLFATPSPTPQDQSESDLGTGAIVGIVLGSAFALILFFLLINKGKRRRSQLPSSGGEVQPNSRTPVVPVAVLVDESDSAVNSAALGSIQTPPQTTPVGGRDVGFLPDASPSERQLEAERQNVAKRASTKGRDHRWEKKVALSAASKKKKEAKMSSQTQDSQVAAAGPEILPPTEPNVLRDE